MPQRSFLQRVLLTLGKPKVGLPLAVALVVITVPLAYRASRLAGLPDPGPSFDVKAFGTVEITDEENAFVEYEKAAGLLVDFSGDRKEFNRALAEGWPVASEPVRKWLADNRQALEIWKRGTAKPDALYHQPKDMHAFTVLYAMPALREFRRLAQFEAGRLRRRGDVEGAWEWHRACFRASRHCGRWGGCVQRLIGADLHATAADRIVQWAADPRVEGSLLHRALNELRSDDQLTQPASTVIKTAYLGYLNSLSDFGYLEKTLDATRSSYEPLSRLELWLQHQPECARRIWAQFVTNWLSQIDKPLPERTAMVSADLMLFRLKPELRQNPEILPPEKLKQAFEASVVAKAFVPAMKQVDTALRRERARQHALEMALAAQWYHREHGRFPENAEQLVGKSLPKIPADPFSRTGEPMQYRRDGDRAVVWSVGENTVDDGGRVESTDGTKSADVGFRIVPPDSHE